jgi:hypothetical protein
VTTKPNRFVPVRAALVSLLPVNVSLLAVAVVWTTLQRLDSPVWLPAAAAAGAALAAFAWQKLVWSGRRPRRQVPVEPLPDGASLGSPRASACRLGLKLLIVLLVVMLQGGLHGYHHLQDLVVMVFVPAVYGWLVVATGMQLRRLDQAEARLGMTLFAPAGLLEGCGGTRHLFAAPADGGR